MQHVRQWLLAALIVTVCIAVLFVLFQNRKQILLWMSGFRYRPRIPAETRISRDLQYTVFNGRSMKLDLYLPASEGPHPLIVWLHSGAWKTLDASCIEQGAMDQVARGYALASVGYSLSMEEKWPAQLSQVRAALVWLGTNAGRYGIDPMRTVLWGMSAGGHIASVVGASDDLIQGSTPYRIRAVVAWCTPFDLAGLGSSALSAARQLLGYEPELDAEKSTPANPARYINPGDPAFYILHGGADTVVPISQAVRFRDALSSAGVGVTFRQMDGYTHEDRRFSSRECMTELEGFLDRSTLP